MWQPWVDETEGGGEREGIRRRRFLAYTCISRPTCTRVCREVTKERKSGTALLLNFLISFNVVLITTIML